MAGGPLFGIGRRQHERRYAVAVDGVVRYVGSQVECRTARRDPGTEERSRRPRTKPCCAWRA
jgi:hypothetical protein